MVTDSMKHKSMVDILCYLFIKLEAAQVLQIDAVKSWLYPELWFFIIYMVSLALEIKINNVFI